MQGPRAGAVKWASCASAFCPSMLPVQHGCALPHPHGFGRSTPACTPACTPRPSRSPVMGMPLPHSSDGHQLLTRYRWSKLAGLSQHHAAAPADGQFGTVPDEGPRQGHKHTPQQTNLPIYSQMEAIREILLKERASLSQSQLSSHTYSLRQLMLQIPVHIRQAGDQRATLQPKLRQVTVACLALLCQSFMSCHQSLSLVELVLLINTLRVARKLGWLRIAAVNAVVQQTAGASTQSARARKTLPSPPGAPSLFAIDPPQQADDPDSDAEQQDSWVAELSASVAELLPHLKASGIKFISTGQLSAPHFTKLLTEMEDMRIALTADDRPVVLSAAQALSSSSTTSQEERVELVVACARLCGVRHVAGELWPDLIKALDRDLQSGGTPHVLSLPTAAQLLWLAAQLNIQLQESASSASLAALGSASAAEWQADLLLLQGTRPHQAPQPWPVTEQGVEAVDKRQATQGVPSVQEVLLMHVRAALESRQGGREVKLTHLGTLVSNWLPAGMPCSQDWMLLLVARALPVLDRTQPSQSQALCLAQLAQLPLIGGATTRHEDDVPYDLGTWLDAYIPKVVKGCEHLSDAQLHWVVSCLAATQRAYPALDVLPSLNVPAWISSHPAMQGSKGVGTRQQVLDDGDDDGEGEGQGGARGQGWFELLRNHAQPQFESSRDRRGRKPGRRGKQQPGRRDDRGSKHSRQGQAQPGGLVLGMLADTHVPWGTFETVLVSLSMADVVAVEGRGAWSSEEPPTETDTNMDADDIKSEDPLDFELGQVIRPSGTHPEHKLAPHLPMYSAWQLLTQLLLRYVTASAVGAIQSCDHSGPKLLGDAYQAALTTSEAAQQLQETRAAIASPAAAQLRDHVIKEAAAGKVALLMDALASIPRVWRVLFSTNAAGALVAAIGRCSPDMTLPTLLMAVQQTRQLGIQPRSSTFRGTIQAQAVARIKEGALRRPVGSVLVLSPILHLIRVFYQAKMRLGPQLEAALTQELLSWHLKVDGPGQAGLQEVSAAPSGGRKGMASGGPAANLPAAGAPPPHALHLPCGYLLDKELSQLMKLMVQIAFAGSSRLLDHLQVVAGLMVRTGSLRPKYAGPYLSHMTKLGVFFDPQFLADLLECALIENGEGAPAEKHAPRVPRQDRDRQAKGPVLCYSHLRGVAAAVRRVKYPAGSAAAKALDALDTTLHVLDLERQAGNMQQGPKLVQVANELAVLRAAPLELVGSGVKLGGDGRDAAVSGGGDVDDFIARTLAELKSERGDS